MARDIYEDAVGVKSAYGRQHADAQFEDYLTNLRAMELNLKKLGVEMEISDAQSSEAAVLLTTPFGRIVVDRCYYLDGEHVAVAALYYADQKLASETTRQPLYALYLSWNRQWTDSNGQAFEPDFNSDKYRDVEAFRSVVAAMAAKLRLDTDRCASFKRSDGAL